MIKDSVKNLFTAKRFGKDFANFQGSGASGKWGFGVLEAVVDIELPRVIVTRLIFRGLFTFTHFFFI